MNPDYMFNERRDPQMRLKRAQAMTARVMQVLSKHIPDERNAHRDATRDLLELFYDGGFDVITDEQRKAAGLLPRDDYGWTVDELRIMEAKRIEAMLQPPQPIIISRDDILRSPVVTPSA